MKYKIKATHFVEAPDWTIAEQIVERNLSEPDQIDSEPVSKSPRDIIMYGLASKIFETHQKIFFESDDYGKTYEQKLESLKAETNIWLNGILNELISNNEEHWV